MKFQKLHEKAILPRRAYAGDAGLDLSSISTLMVRAGEQVVVRTGVAVEIPNSYYGLVVPRSGLAFKFGLTITNSPGIIDSEYRGEIKVLIHNTGHDDFLIECGMRIAQLVIAPVVLLDPEWGSVNDTSRSTAGFGSSGLGTTGSAV